MKRFVSFLLVACALFGMTSCSRSKKSEPSSDPTIENTALSGSDAEAAGSSEKTGQTTVDPNVTTITFAVPTLCHAEDLHLLEFNEELLKDGYNYQLEVKSLEYGEYGSFLEKELKDGNVDVAFLGLDEAGGNMFNYIDKGLILQLDDILSSANGKKVYEAFPETIWSRVKCKGHFYSLPFTPHCKRMTGIYAAFNRDYISDEVIDNWDGSLEGVYEIIKNAEWKEESVNPFQYFLTDYDFDLMIGCEIKDGLLYDYDSREIRNPLESEKLIGYLRLLEKMKSEGFLRKNVSYQGNCTYPVSEKDLEEGKFLVVLSAGEPKKTLEKENVRIKELAPVLKTNLNGSIAISSKSEDVNAVMDFLGILYNEGKYANLLIYGKQDVDYKLVDGCVVNIDGSDYTDVFFKRVCLGTYLNTYPVMAEGAEEGLRDSEKEAYLASIKNSAASPFLGFAADLPATSKIPDDINNFLASLNTLSLDEALEKYSKILAEDGMEEYLRTAKEQWETYSK